MRGKVGIGGHLEFDIEVLSAAGGKRGEGAEYRVIVHLHDAIGPKGDRPGGTYRDGGRAGAERDPGNEGAQFRAGEPAVECAVGFQPAKDQFHAGDLHVGFTAARAFSTINVSTAPLL